MSKLFVILFLLFIAIVSCDGRGRKHKINEGISTHKKLNDSSSIVIKFEPKTYTEVKTDTLLKNGFRVNYKFYSNMDNSIQKKNLNDETNQKMFYREFEVALNISKDGKKVFSSLINKDFFHKNDFSTKGKLDKAILKNVSVDEFHSLKNDAVALIFDYYPEPNDRLYRYKLVVSENGTYKLFNEFVIF